MPVQMNATIQSNTFKDGTVPGGRGIEFLNHNSVGATFGTITIGGADSLANTFENGLGQFIYLDPSSGGSAASGIPNYAGYGNTTMAPFSVNLNVNRTCLNWVE